ncbi:metal ABC transporter solute-binding protein, Zn/Mn family [Deinococcus lacus]|uniref:Metal ABC transporter solute-binding protein, Zn/Mn family n=1 Tax=Deinococcus lacus TaxID=392561 RepID=A0ABW1YG85_9DEIO
MQAFLSISLVVLAGLALVTAVAFGQPVTAMSGTAPAQHSGPLKVTTTVNMVGDLARVVGGSRVEVTELMGAGVDPHLYKASARDVRRLAGADLVLYAGLHLEGKMVELLEKTPVRWRSRTTFPPASFCGQAAALAGWPECLTRTSGSM